VLFVDLHLAYADAAVYFGAEPRFSIVDALENVRRLDMAFLKSIAVKTASGVDLLASADRDPRRPIDRAGIPRLLDVARNHYQVVVLDVPRSGRAVVDPLGHADAIVVVSNHELSGLRSASHLAAGLRDVYGAPKVSVVVSRFDRESEITRKDIERAVGEPVRQTFPSEYRTALNALNSGKPLVLSNHSKLSAAIDCYARSLSGITAQVEHEGRAGLLGMLTRKR
jgi:pilus assembly protein CpaE